MMSEVRKLLATGVFIMAMSSQALAQEAMFSQYYAAPLFLNPSLAGAETNIIAGVNYRSQWSSLSPYQTSQASMSYPLVTNGYRRRHLGGVGGTLFNETAGANSSFKTTGFMAAGAYNLTFDKYRNNFVAFGLQGGIVQKRIEGNYNWGSQYDPFLGFNNAITPSVAGLTQTATIPIVNAGLTMFYNSQKILHKTGAFLGLAVSNMNRPNESFVGHATTRLPLLLKAHGGVDYPLNHQIIISYNVLWMYQNGINQLNGGAYLSYQANQKTSPFTTTLGAWYRLKDSFIVLAGFTVSQLSLGFSYDINASALRNTTSGPGAYEISLAYRIAKVKSLRRFSTPLL